MGFLSALGGIGGAFLGGPVGAMIGSQIGGAIDGQNAADDAIAAQRDAAKRADARYEQQRQDNMPALEARNASLARMRELLGISDNKAAQGYGSMASPLTSAEVMAEPGYQFGLQQGQKALDRQMAARGMRNSGAALVAASRYGTDYATTKYGDAFNRLQADRGNQFGRFATTAGLGQPGAVQAQQAGSSQASNALSLGDAYASNRINTQLANNNSSNQLTGWYANNQSGSGMPAWSSGGVTGTNDRTGLNTGNAFDLFARYGVGAD